MKQRYRVEAVLAASKENKLEVPRDVMEVLGEQVCSSLEIPEIIERLNELGYQACYEPLSHASKEIASFWITVGKDEMLLNCQMEPLALH